MIYIFTEYFQKSGIGHYRRCSALAELFRRKGIKTQIILDTDADGFDDFDIETVVESWLTKKLHKWIQRTPEAIVIDSYRADYSLYQEVVDAGIRLVCIDDFDRLNYPRAAILYNGGVGGSIYNYRDRYSKVLEGPEFILLRKPFQEKIEKHNIPKSIKRILVSMGGSDPKNLTLRILTVINRRFPEIQIDAIIGPAFESPDRYEKKNLPSIAFHKNLDALEIKTLMQSVDLCISAGGQTVYELGRLGIPMILIKTADNQLGNLTGLKEMNIIENYLDPEESRFEEMLIEEIFSLFSFERRLKMSELSFDIFSDRSQSIASAILN
ncbi:hypothetical protein JWG45_09265 [Leptospira sp. 201903070]|uniref:Glycosyl transferase n=1 Tax=Leptospira ainlahdjerensis TaxID=2810033 RepID=A0ABS2UEL7_9LEPT|nr:hypothetical protein [Leptospira ainlahdjerensis]